MSVTTGDDPSITFHTEEGRVSHPRFSPDGSKLVFYLSSGPAVGGINTNLKLLDIDSGKIKDIEMPLIRSLSPDFLSNDKIDISWS